MEVDRLVYPAGRGRAEAAAGAVEVDAITTEVIRHALNSAAEQMKRSLIRTAFSPIIHEALDFAVSLYDDRVRLLGQAPSLPIFMGTLSFCVEAAVEAIGGEEALEPGDIIYLNVPYKTGTHPQDAALVMPVFTRAQELIGFAAVKAHLLDVGGKEPYSTDTTDVFQEGTLFPGVKLFSRGQVVRDVFRTLLANSRVPRAIEGDVNAEVVSLRTGAAELVRIVERYGLDIFRAAVERMLDYGEAVVRSYFARIPDGRYVANGHMDNDGVSPDPVEFEVAVEVEGSSVRIDYTNAPDARRGPINCPLPDTVSASRVAVMMLAGAGEQPNEGHFRPIEVVTRPGSMFHPLPPSPCFLVGWATLQAMEVIYRALSEAMPEGVPASSGGDILVLAWWGVREATGEPWADCSVHPVGQGANARADGADHLIHISEAATRFPSIEVLEARNPLLVERMELAQDSGGPGRHRGGLGCDIHVRAVEDSWLTAVVERTTFPAWGLEGGGEGRPNGALLRLPDGSQRRVAKATRLFVPKGALLEVVCGGGGGYGSPSARAPEALAADLLEGYVSPAYAARHHGS